MAERRPYFRGALKRPDYLVALPFVGTVAFDVKAKSLYEGAFLFDVDEIERLVLVVPGVQACAAAFRAEAWGYDLEGGCCRGAGGGPFQAVAGALKDALLLA